jgi:hypothetical protein
MTPAERRALQRLSRRAAQLEPQLVVALLRAFKLLRDQYSEAEVTRLIQAGRLTEAVNVAAPVEVIERALNPASVVLTEGVIRTARNTIPELPAAARRIITAFDYLNPRTVESIRRLDTSTIRTVREEMRQALRETIEQGLVRGVNPRTTARNLRGTIGLAPNQSRAVDSFRAALEGGRGGVPSRTLLPRTNAIGQRLEGRALRDGRLDGIVRRAIASKTPLTPEQIDRMVARYQERMLSFAAETHARTAALEAQKLGQQLAWSDAKASGALGDAEVVAVWVATDDNRTREEHAAMNGEERPIDGVYSNGDAYPGQGSYNCRCSEIFRVRKPSFALAA